MADHPNGLGGGVQCRAMLDNVDNLGRNRAVR
jgi:hypothetical protein